MPYNTLERRILLGLRVFKQKIEVKRVNILKRN